MPTAAPSPAKVIDQATREHMIAEAAYYIAEKNGFSPGNEMSHWLEAEAQIEQSLHSEK